MYAPVATSVTHTVAPQGGANRGSIMLSRWDPGLAMKLFQWTWARRLARRKPLRGRRFIFISELVSELKLDIGVVRAKLVFSVVVEFVVFETATHATVWGEEVTRGRRRNSHRPLTTQTSVVSACLLLMNRTYRMWRCCSAWLCVCPR